MKATEQLVIAVPRGALFGETLDLLERLGRDVSEVRNNDRKLIFPEAGLVTMRPFDVVTYVAAGVADLGITGKDVLMEREDDDVYELCDLTYGACRMIVASLEGDTKVDERLQELGTLRVATKYPRITKRHFKLSGRPVQVVEVKGSVELAPVTELADVIVDLTQSGATLVENGLVEREEVAVSTARLIANPVSYNYRTDEVDRFVELIKETL